MFTKPLRYQQTTKKPLEKDVNLAFERPTGGRNQNENNNTDGRSSKDDF
jgi:hypothetical protein